MIYLGFLFDYLIMLFLPINSYFVVNDLDKNNFLAVLFIGFLLDIMYHRLFINLFILLFLYLVLKIINIKKKNTLIKNLFVYFIYFNIMHFMFGYNHNYFISIFIGLILQLGYIKLSKLLLK